MADDAAVRETLVALEQQSWVAWKARDGKFFDGFLSDDHVEVGFGGVIGKDDVVKGVASPACAIESYALGDMQLTRITQDAAVLVYRAEQRRSAAASRCRARCGQRPSMPSATDAGST